MNNHPEDKDIKAILEVMNELVKKKDEPCVGIFWYDTEENDTFGVQTAFIDDSKVLDNSPCGSEVRTIKSHTSISGILKRVEIRILVLTRTIINFHVAEYFILTAKWL